MPIIQQGATLREVLKHPSVEECKMVDIGASQTPSRVPFFIHLTRRLPVPAVSRPPSLLSPDVK